jgi:bifunctional non-homologous end joining protein LigD
MSLPDAPVLMLATLVAEPFDHADWLFEPKLDGLRVWCRFDGRRVRLVSRNGKDQNFQFPDVAAALAESLKRPAVVDGEIVCLDDRGLSSFRALQQRFHVLDAAEVRRRSEQFPAYLYLFDVMYAGRYDVTSLELHERKTILRKAVKWSDRVRWTEGTPRRGTALFRQTAARPARGSSGSTSAVGTSRVAATTGSRSSASCGRSS